MVARSPLRHVHPLGPLQRARAATNGPWRTKAFRSRSTSSSPSASSPSPTPRATGPAGQTGRPEVHGDDHQAPRGLLPLRLQAHRLLRAQARPRPRPGEGIRGGRARRRPARGLLLFADGLAPSRWRALRHRRSRAPPLRRLHPRPDPRAADQLRQDRRPLVRRRLAARRRGLGIGEDERDGVPAPARHHRQQPQRACRAISPRPSRRISAANARLGILHDHERQLGLSAAPTTTGRRPRPSCAT